MVIADNDSCASDENREKNRDKVREKAKKEAVVVEESQSEHDLDQAGSEMDDFGGCNFVDEQNGIDDLNSIAFRPQDHNELKTIIDHHADLD